MLQFSEKEKQRFGKDRRKRKPESFRALFYFFTFSFFCFKVETSEVEEKTEGDVMSLVYCVEDDLDMQGMVVYSLNASGIEAKGLVNGEELWASLETETPDLIILDLNLPGEDGLSILRKLRSDSRKKIRMIPVIIATARGSEFDKVLGLDGGADDYLSKPFGMMEMISRVKAVLRRYFQKEEEKTVYSEGRITLDDKEHAVYVDGKPLKLTLREYELLAILIMNPNVLISREEMFRTIWGQDINDESRTVDVHMGALRTKLGECGSYIQTVRGIGYRFVVD